MFFTNARRSARSGSRRPFRTLLPLLVLALLVAPAFGWENDGESGGNGGGGGDEGNRWQVARLRVTEGSAYLLPDGGQEWDETEGNASLGEGDRANVPEDSAAILSYRGHEALLTGGADLSVIYLRDDRAAYRLSEGKARFRLSDYDFVPVRVSLPSGGRVRMTAPGTYRISIGENDEAFVKVAKGEAVVSDAEGGKVRISTGQQAAIGEGVRVSRYDEPPPPDEVRPPLSPEERSVEAPPDVVYELRDYGDWVVAGDYGYVWRPRVSVGWSPFVFGSWGWSLSLGWNWISYEPWGWYPYHCGRWYQDGRFGWVWVPRGAFAPYRSPLAPRVSWYRPVTYYPATVRMVRDRDQVRWVPLAPRERFVRPVIRRDEVQVYRYARPLPTGTVYSRDWGRGAGRSPEAWRTVETRVTRTQKRPVDDRPVYRIGDPAVPFRGDRVAPATRPSLRPGAAEGPSRRGGEGMDRRSREPRVVTPPGRGGGEMPGRRLETPRRRNDEAPVRRGDEGTGPRRPAEGRIPAPAVSPPPPPGRSAPQLQPAPPAPSAPPPPGRTIRRERPDVSAPPSQAPSPGRPATSVAPPVRVAPVPPPARSAPEGRSVAPPGRGLQEVRPIAPPSRPDRGGPQGERPQRPGRDDDRFAPDGGRGVRGR
jgi:hypothetical protein